MSKETYSIPASPSGRYDFARNAIELFITNQRVVAHNGFSFDFDVLSKTTVPIVRDERISILKDSTN